LTVQTGSVRMADPADCRPAVLLNPCGMVLTFIALFALLRSRYSMRVKYAVSIEVL
jgi:hypothetical protein